MKLLNDYRFILLLVATIGMAPFYPEPHIWGKLKWLLGGAKGMQLLDWFDVFFHGLPWMLLIRLIIIKFSRKHAS